jgi:hypothetical protein
LPDLGGVPVGVPGVGRKERGGQRDGPAFAGVAGVVLDVDVGDLESHVRLTGQGERPCCRQPVIEQDHVVLDDLQPRWLATTRVPAGSGSNFGECCGG